MITLRSDRLRVELAEPGERPNDGFRFDRAGYISEIVLDGDIYFTASEPKNLMHPSSGGRGLCCEYAVDYSSQAEEGEYYPKFGIGLLQKGQEGRYLYYHRYENVREFPISVKVEGSSAVFRTEGIPCLGYELAAQRSVCLNGNCLTVENTVENRGEKPLELSEYCHNFLSIDGMAVGPDYKLDFPMLKDFGMRRFCDMDGRQYGLRGNGRGFAYVNRDGDTVYMNVDLEGMEEKLPFVWRLCHEGVHAFVEGREFFRPDQIRLWSVDHMICPEVFHRFTIKPGERHRWKRGWRFEVF